MSLASMCRVLRLLNINKKSLPLCGLQERYIKRWVAPTFREIKNRQNWVPKYIKPKQEPNPRNTYLEWNLNSELFAFNKRLNENFKDDLLLQAFTHKSYLIQEEMKQKAVGIENPDIRLSHNEELIDEAELFMQDYILAYLRIALPRFPLKGATAIRDHLMSTEVLGDVGKNLGCTDIILSAEYPITVDTLAKTFKALVGALIRSSGNERAAHFVRDFVITALNGKDVNDYWTIEDPVQMLEERLNQEGATDVEYRLISQSAINTLLACYHVGLFIDKKMFAAGYGETVSIAKEMTARDGLRTIFNTHENMPPLNFKIKGIPDIQKKLEYAANTN